MTLEQIKTLIVGVLKGWFANKKVLDKFSESASGELQYEGATLGGETYTDAEVTAAITDILNELNSTSTPASS